MLQYKKSNSNLLSEGTTHCLSWPRNQFLKYFVGILHETPCLGASCRIDMSIYLIVSRHDFVRTSEELCSMVQSVLQSRMDGKLIGLKVLILLISNIFRGTKIVVPK